MGKGKELDDMTVKLLAAYAELDPRTIRRASRDGIDKMRAAKDRERLRKAAKKLGVKLP
jgi:DNA invertase Pin-like site-specific DNA recombinase